ncbi:hypothetical protein [Pseudonocardia sp.]|uniref:hypothetical protein n=1 Tax=Pseudonocardia sp. TaxID=60912 RepID=UPI00261CF409|nr:hypothetical protein [Pseudonocardia sp.]
MDRDLYTECAAELAASPDLVASLLTEHRATSDGWCRSHNVHPERHPCSIRRLAELAAGHECDPAVPA